MTTYKINGTNIDEYFNTETSVVENNSAYNNFPSYEPTIEGNDNISQLYNIKNKFKEISLETMHGTKCDDTTVPAYEDDTSPRHDNNCPTQEKINDTIWNKNELGNVPIYDINNQTDIYVQIFDNVLLPAECEKIINLFNKYPKEQYKGKTLADLQPTKGKLDKSKNTHEINITSLAKKNKDFSELDTLFYNKLQIYLNKYMSKIQNTIHTPTISHKNISDTGYQIQQYKKNTGYYTNHIDSHIYASNQGGYEERVITYIWYLNDINEGGETNFINQFKIKPVAGRLLFFPSTWSYPHAGLIPVSSDKYIVTGWIYQNRKS